MRKLLYVYKTQAIFNCGDRFTADQIGPCILPYCIIIDNTIDSRVRSMDPTIGPTETAVTLIIMHCKLTERFGSEDCFAAHKLLIQSFAL